MNFIRINSYCSSYYKEFIEWNKVFLFTSLENFIVYLLATIFERYEINYLLTVLHLDIQLRMKMIFIIILENTKGDI